MKTLVTGRARLKSCERFDFRDGSGFGLKLILYGEQEGGYREIEANAYGKPEFLSAMLEKASDDKDATVEWHGEMKVKEAVISGKGNKFYPHDIRVSGWRALFDADDKPPVGVPQPGLSDESVPF